MPSVDTGGAGGIGKTRLALQAATGRAGRYPDGAYFVPLSPVTAAEYLLPALADALRFVASRTSDPHAQLMCYLREKRLLLVMDNFEHLLAGGGIVSEILEFCPGMKVLATSRERLNLQAETIYQVSGMAAPEVSHSEDNLEYDALTLFVQSASKVCPGFEPNPEEMRQITQISKMVEGLPLGIA